MALAVGATVLVASVALVVILAGLFYVSNEIFDNEVPRCDAEPVILQWSAPQDRWRRSDVFELVDDSQTVQVDAALARDDGGVIQTGTTVYAIAAGAELPAPVDDATPTTLSFGGTLVGRGVDGINEQVTLAAGRWQLIADGGVSPAELRWPC